jgi:hypothetical protein
MASDEEANLSRTMASSDEEEEDLDQEMQSLCSLSDEEHDDGDTAVSEEDAEADSDDGFEKYLQQLCANKAAVPANLCASDASDSETDISEDGAMEAASLSGQSATGHRVGSLGGDEVRTSEEDNDAETASLSGQSAIGDRVDSLAGDDVTAEEEYVGLFADQAFGFYNRLGGLRRIDEIRPQLSFETWQNEAGDQEVNEYRSFAHRVLRRCFQEDGVEISDAVITMCFYDVDPYEDWIQADINRMFSASPAAAARTPEPVVADDGDDDIALLSENSAAVNRDASLAKENPQSVEEVYVDWCAAEAFGYYQQCGGRRSISEMQSQFSFASWQAEYKDQAVDAYRVFAARVLDRCLQEDGLVVEDGASAMS